MANTYRVIPKLISSLSANQQVYTVPTATTSIIRSISVYNTDTNPMDVTLSILDSSTSTTFNYDYKAGLAATSKFEFLIFKIPMFYMHTSRTIIPPSHT